MNDTMYKNVALLILFGFMLYNCRFAANKGTNSLKHDKEVCQNESMNDSKLYKKYQYFDEFSLEGRGEAVKTPFVFVKRTKNRIVVISSDNIQDSIVYNNEHGLWINRLSYDLANKWPSKEDTEPPRSYLRFFRNDSIFEYREIYFDKRIVKSIFIKTPTECTYIMLLEKVDVILQKDTIEQILNIVNCYKKDSTAFVAPIKNMRFPNVRYVNKYHIIVGDKEYLFKAFDNNSPSYVFDKNSLSFWGIQPGWDKINQEKTWHYNQ